MIKLHNKLYIIERAVKCHYKKSHTVYFLISKEEIVYVGRSVDVFKRLGDHSSGYEKKVFDCYFCIKTNENNVSKLEKKYIAKFKPKYNNIPSYVD